MRPASSQPAIPFKRHRLSALCGALVVSLLAAGPAPAGPPPPPSQGSAPPPVLRAPPPPIYTPHPPAPVTVQAPPGPSAPRPLPIAMRVIYAPFYVTGLILRYGVYYLLVAPLEVLGRTLDYGVDGGVEPDPNVSSR